MYYLREEPRVLHGTGVWCGHLIFRKGGGFTHSVMGLLTVLIVLTA